MTAGHGTVDFYPGILPAIAPGVAEHLGISIGSVVALVGIGSLVSNGIQPFIGAVMERWNLSWALWVAAVLSTFPSLLGFANGYYALLALVLLGALGNGLFHPEGVLSAHDASGDNAYLAIPFFMAGGGILNALAAPICIQWSSRFGYHALALLALPGLGVALALLLNHDRKKRQHPSIVIRPRSKRITKLVAGGMSFWPLLLVSMFLGVSIGLFLAVISSHYELAFGPAARSWSGWVLMVVGVTGSLASFWWGHMTKKHDYYKVVLLTQALTVPLFIVMAYAPSPAAGFAAALPLSLFAPGAVYPVSVSLVRNASGLTQSMRAGLVVGGTWGMSALVVMLSGWLLKRGMPSHNLVLISAASSFGALVVAVSQLIANKKRRETA